MKKLKNERRLGMKKSASVWSVILKVVIAAVSALAGALSTNAMNV